MIPIWQQKKVSLTELKKHLRRKSQNELINEIADLYKKFENVKEYYQASFFRDDASILEKYKLIIKEKKRQDNKTRRGQIFCL